MTPPPSPDLKHLLGFNHQLLEQAAGLIEAFRGHGAPSYRLPVGAHLRHVIEHLEALVMPAKPGHVDYDARARDARLEREPDHALARVRTLQACLMVGFDAELDTPVEVHGIGGIQGDFAFSVRSTVGRELAFVASHTVHHFALLRPHLERLGWPLEGVFGRAPATVAHDRQLEQAACAVLTA